MQHPHGDWRRLDPAPIHIHALAAGTGVPMRRQHGKAVDGKRRHRAGRWRHRSHQLRRVAQKVCHSLQLRAPLHPRGHTSSHSAQ